MLRNTILVPSGDQLESASIAALFVNLVCPVPSEFIVYISKLPSLALENVILVPSGDQLGEVSAAALFDRLVCLVPSEFIVYISKLPSLALENAILPFVPRITILTVAFVNPPLPSDAV